VKTARLAVTDLRVLFHSRVSLVWFFLMPVIFSLFFGIAFSGPGERPRAGLVVVNEDGGFLGRELVGALSTEDFSITRLDPDSVTVKRLEPRAIFIPAGFTERVTAGEQTPVTLKTAEGANRKASMAAEAGVLRAIVRVVGTLSIMELEDGGSRGASLREAYEQAKPEEDLVTLEVEYAGRLKGIPSGFNHTAPGMVVMFVLMCVLIYGVHLLIEEKRSGLLHRIAAGPVSTVQILTGKIFSRAAAGAVQVVFLFILSAVLFHVSFGSSPLGLVLLMGSYVLCVAGLSLMVGALVDTPEYASGLSVLLALIMASLGGCWWPLEIVPSPMREAAFLFPTGWAMDGLHLLMSFGYGTAAVAGHVLVLLVMFVVFTSLGVRFMGRHLTPGS
jgi:ABC-2 type transport system permease protein